MLVSEGGFVRKIELCYFNIMGIYCLDEGILNFIKVLLEFFIIVDLNDEYNFFVLSVKGIQVYNNLFIVIVIGFGLVIVCQLDIV